MNRRDDAQVVQELRDECALAGAPMAGDEDVAALLGALREVRDCPGTPLASAALTMLLDRGFEPPRSPWSRVALAGRFAAAGLTAKALLGATVVGAGVATAGMTGTLPAAEQIISDTVDALVPDDLELGDIADFGTADHEGKGADNQPEVTAPLPIAETAVLTPDPVPDAPPSEMSTTGSAAISEGIEEAPGQPWNVEIPGPPLVPGVIPDHPERPAKPVKEPQSTPEVPDDAGSGRPDGTGYPAPGTPYTGDSNPGTDSSGNAGGGRPDTQPEQAEVPAEPGSNRGPGNASDQAPVTPGQPTG